METLIDLSGIPGRKANLPLGKWQQRWINIPEGQALKMEAVSVDTVDTAQVSAVRFRQQTGHKTYLQRRQRPDDTYDIYLCHRSPCPECAEPTPERGGIE